MDGTYSQNDEMPPEPNVDAWVDGVGQISIQYVRFYVYVYIFLEVLL